MVRLLRAVVRILWRIIKIVLILALIAKVLSYLTDRDSNKERDVEVS